MTTPLPILYFVGVTTGQSASQRIFPLWAQILALGQAQLKGVDLPLDAPAKAYWQTLQRIKSQEQARGALITAHKINLWRYCSNDFDELTPEAQISREISCIYKRQGRMIGHAVDAWAADQAMIRTLGQTYWAERSAEMLCLGAGGAATALILSFALYHPPSNHPARILLVDREPSRLERLQRILDSLPQAPPKYELILNDNSAANDRLVSSLSPGSLIVNATGMGKDRPGSPITDRAIFPQNGIAWDLNYRGELTFLKQARAQAHQRSLRVVDGWDYFLIGWAEGISRVFDTPISPERFSQMKQVAEAERHSLTAT